MALWEEKSSPIPSSDDMKVTCYTYYSTGKCKHTDCKFKHVAGPGVGASALASEGAAPAERPTSASKPKPAIDKSKPCPHWAKNSCKFGDTCAWSHSGPGGGITAAPAAEDLAAPREGGSDSAVEVAGPPPAPPTEDDSTPRRRAFVANAVPGRKRWQRRRTDAKARGTLPAAADAPPLAPPLAVAQDE